MVADDAVSLSCEFLSHTMRKILFCHRGPAGFIFTHALAVTLIIMENRNAGALTRHKAQGKGQGFMTHHRPQTIQGTMPASQLPALYHRWKWRILVVYASFYLCQYVGRF